MKAEEENSSISSGATLRYGVKRSEDLVDLLYSDMVQSLLKK